MTTASAHGTGCTLVIPAYDPGEGLLPLVNRLVEMGFDDVVVVNDGSAASCGPVFQLLEGVPAVTVLHHEVNRGKGAALKTAFRHVLDRQPSAGHRLLTLDADGQHRAEDVQALARHAEAHPEALVLGVRSFSGDVPWKSRFGNRLTRRLLRWLSRIDVQDTQTGLRCLSRDFAEQCLSIEADRYEFELECLLLARQLGLSIGELPIATIYIDDNAGSHFRPVVDSLRVYWVFLRYILSSLGSFLIDIALFTLFHALSGHIIGSTYAARFISGSFNFLVNKHAVFRSGSRGRYPLELLGYVLLAVGIATLSGVLVALLARRSDLPVPLLKVFVDSVLFVVNFGVQRWLIFGAARRGKP